MDTLIQDGRYAFRALRKSPGFTLVAVLTLALGIGANTAIFSVVNAALLRPYPFPEPDRLVAVRSLAHGEAQMASPADFLDWRGMAQSFAGVAAFTGASMALSGEGPAEEVRGETVSADFFRILGVAPALGRTFGPDEESPGRDHEVILGDALWRSRFGADPLVVGRTVRLDGQPWLVVGVMPRGFAFPSEARMWMPLAFAPEIAAMRGGHYLDVIARLRPGATFESASGEMAAIAARLGAEYPAVNIHWSAGVASLRDATVGDVRPTLLLLLGAVGFVLLIACVNVANLLLSRGTGRAREHAVRAALGASTLRLARGVMAESLWLGLAGSALGLALAAWGTDAVVALAPQGLPGLADVRVDPVVLAFAVALGVMTSLLFGLLPAWRATHHATLADRLRDGGAALGGRHGRRSRQGLVVAEVALAVVLVVGAGLLLKSFVRLRGVDPGFDPAGVLTFDVSLPDATTPPQAERFFGSLIGRLEALPGVQSAGGIFGLPLRDFGYGITLSEVDGRQLSPQEQEAGVVPQIRVVTPDFFRTLGIRLVRGRAFTDTDREGTVPVAVVSETAARRIFGARDPLGHHFTLGTRLGLGKDHLRVGGEVIGVVRDVHDQTLAAAGRPWVYVVHAQFPVSYLSLALRTGGKPASLVGPARAALAAVDPDVPMDRVRTMGEWVSTSMAGRRFYAWLIGGFAALALGLAAVGVYGVLAQSVGERTREIGLRVALGAAPGDVTGLVVRQGLRPAALGLGIGLALAVAVTSALTKVLAPMLFAVRPTDVATYAAVVAVILAVALVAAWAPARRAARVDPMVALRSE